MVDVGGVGGRTALPWGVPTPGASLEETVLDASTDPCARGDVAVVVAGGLLSVWTGILFLGIFGS